MFKRILRLAALLTAAVVLLTGCRGSEQTSGGESNGKTNSSALTWGTWSNYQKLKPFLDLLNETYPEIELDFISYFGANATGYSWAQMRADDISDIFITSQVFDKELAKERLVDLSGYDFLNGLSNSVLDQAAIDGGIYLLPVSYTMTGIYYNKTLMEENGWEVPTNFAELEALCKEIEEAGLMPGVVGTRLTGGPFSTVFNLAKTDWFTTPDGVKWEKDFLAGDATAEGRWEGTMDYVQKYIDIGMFNVDPDDRGEVDLITEYLGKRKAVFCAVVYAPGSTTIDGSTDELGMMPYIGEDGSKNIYMYSPSYYFGISRRLTEPGNEKKLEDAIKIMSLIFSPEGQKKFVSESAPTQLSVIHNENMSENALAYDAQKALHDGKAFPMTYVHWDGVLADMGQAYKDWFRGTDGADGAYCIKQMDTLQREYLQNAKALYFCESTADFTLEQTARLFGKALGSAAGADAAIIPLGAFHDGNELKAGVNGKLYKGAINTEISNTICPAVDGEYAVMTMTGAQAKEIAAAGFDADGNGNPYRYVLVERGAGLEDDKTYKVAFPTDGYTDETSGKYPTDIVKGSVRTILHEYLAEQKTVSPDGNPWE